MNYGKKKASEKQRHITSKATMKKKRRGVRFFKGILICFLVLMITAAIGGGLFVKKIIDDSPNISPEDVKPSGYTTFVYAEDGTTELQKLVSSGSNRVYKTIDQIPKDLQHAFVAIEDARFYEHNGIDLQGILRAGVVGLTSGNFSQGASTITQQLIKNNIFDFMSENGLYDKVTRKIQEQYLAIELEKKMDKEEILENYMNTINLGQNTLGVQAASKRYFNKDVSELTLSECAVIAAITQNPGKYNPVTNPQDNAKRREKVLSDMQEQGYISQAQHDEALVDNVYDRIQNVNTEISNASVQSYFIDALIEQVMEDLTDPAKLGYTESQAYNLLYKGGLTIFSTQDPAAQQIVEEEINDDSNYPRLKEWGLSYALTVTRADGTQENYGSGHIKKYMKEMYQDDQGLVFSTKELAYKYIEEFKSTIAQEGDTYDEKIELSPQPQASVTVIDQTTGEIKALGGGRGTKLTSLSLNRAYNGSKRQPGSCFKILAAYAPALDSTDMTLASIIKDEPYNYANGKPVRNWYGNRYYGNVTVRKAIEQSMNICAVKTITDITPQLGFKYVENFGISTLVDNLEINGQIKSDMVQSLALGGITDGVRNYELGSAYAAIANGGVYKEPILYTKILDHDGNILLDNTTTQETHTVLKESTAYLLTSAMEDVISKGTGKPARLSNMPVAGKTGTTNSNVDFWLSAYTPYYTCTVWEGYDDNKKMPDGNWNYHMRLWKSIMSRIHEDLPYKDFKVPNSIEKKTICTATGKLAISGNCPSTTEYFAAGTAPTQSCSGHAVEKSDEENTDETTTDDNLEISGNTTDSNGGNESQQPSNGQSNSDTTNGSTGNNTGTTNSGTENSTTPSTSQ